MSVADIESNNEYSENENSIPDANRVGVAMTVNINSLTITKCQKFLVIIGSKSIEIAGIIIVSIC